MDDRKMMEQVESARIALVKDGFLNIRQAEDFSGLKKSKLYALMQSGELPYAKIGAARKIPRKALLDFMAKNLVMRSVE